MHTQGFTNPQFLRIGLTHKNVPSGVANCRNVPFCGRANARLTGVLSKGGKMHGVATNVYLWKTSEKSKETGRNGNSKFGSCIYV